MIRNYWITKDCFDRIVNVNFVEPTLAIYNVFLHMLTETELTGLANKLAEGCDFTLQTERYRLIVEGNRTGLFVAGDRCEEYIYTDLLAEVLTKYHAELAQMDAELNRS